MSRPALRWAACAWFLVTSASAVSASPWDMFGVGARERALAGAGTATAVDYAAAWYNPAGIVAATGITASFGWFYADPTLEIDGHDVGVETTQGLEFGFVLPGRLLGARVAFGGGFHVPDERVVRFLVLSRERVQFALYSNATQRIVATLPLAVRITDWLDVGIGTSVIGDNSGGVDFVIRQEGQGVSEGSLQAAQLAVATPMAGVMFHPTAELDVGAAYRGEISIELDTPVVIRFDPLVIPPSPIPVIEASVLDVSALTVTHFQPQQAALATAWRPWPELLATLQLTWRGWSSYVPSIPSTKTILSGGLGELLPNLPEFPVPDPHFRDTLEPAVGVEWRALRGASVDVDVRAGYFFRPSPVPSQSGATNLVDNDVHGVGFGLGLAVHVLEDVLRAPPRLDLSGQAQLLADQFTRKLDPADPVGSYRSGGRVLAVGLSATVVY